MLRIFTNTYSYILFLHIGSSSLLKYAEQNVSKVILSI